MSRDYTNGARDQAMIDAHYAEAIAREAAARGQARDLRAIRRRDFEALQASTRRRRHKDMLALKVGVAVWVLAGIAAALAHYS